MYVCTIYVLQNKEDKVETLFPKKPPLSPIGAKCEGTPVQSYLGFANSRTIKKDKSFSPFRIPIEICSFTTYFRTQKNLLSHKFCIINQKASMLKKSYEKNIVDVANKSKQL